MVDERMTREDTGRRSGLLRLESGKQKAASASQSFNKGGWAGKIRARQNWETETEGQFGKVGPV